MDLPDYYRQTVSVGVEATSVTHGVDAAKSATPTAGDIYYATDTHILYFCAVDGAWIGIDAASSVEGILTMYANVVGGGFRYTGLGAPVGANDAARKADVDAEVAARIADVNAEEAARIAADAVIDAKLDDIAVTTPVRAIDTIYRNTTGKLLLVIVSIEVEDGEDATFQMGVPTPPVTLYAEVGNWNAASVMAPISIIVPVNWYYRVVSQVGTPIIRYWTEEALL